LKEAKAMDNTSHAYVIETIKQPVIQDFKTRIMLYKPIRRMERTINVCAGECADICHFHCGNIKEIMQTNLSNISW
jgi:hypothetical protein